MTKSAIAAAALPEANPPSTVLLHAVSNELSDLGRTGAMLQDLIAGKVRAGSLSGMALLDAQAADLLVQTLAELAKFLRSYAEALDGGADDPLALALDGVLLSELSRKLAPHLARADDDAGAGDLELF